MSDVVTESDIARGPDTLLPPHYTRARLQVFEMFKSNMETIYRENWGSVFFCLRSSRVRPHARAARLPKKLHLPPPLRVHCTFPSSFTKVETYCQTRRADPHHRADADGAS